MNPDPFSLTNLQNKINSLLYENNAYKLYIINLEKAFLTLENDYSTIKYQHELLKSKQSYYENLKSDITLKKNKISDLEREILIQKVKYKKNLNEKEKNYERDMEEARRLGEISKTKIQNSEKVEKLNELLFYKIIELENKIKQMEEEEKIKMEEKEKDFEERLKDMKVKMLDFIKEVEKETEKKDIKKIKEKINLIHKNSLLNELEFQSLQLEDLLKQREHLDKLISQMKNDIEVHKKVEKILIEKNKKYTNMIRHLSVKINKDEIKKSQEKEFDNFILNLKNKNDILEKDLSTKAKNSTSFSQKNLFNSKLNKEKNIIFENSLNKTNFSLNNIKDNKIIYNKRNKIQSDILQNNSSLDNLNLSLLSPFQNKLRNKFNQALDIVSLQRELIKKVKYLEDYKSKYESYKTKLEFINNKYINIIKIFDEALEKIYKENEMDKINEIYIDIEDLKKCDFSKLSAEQKYSIITLLIKHLLPLINEENLPQNIKNNIIKINTKFYFNEHNNSAFTSKSLSTTTNGKIYNNSKTSKYKKIIEYVDEKYNCNNTQKSSKSNISKSPKKIVHNLNIEGYLNSNISGFISPKIANNTTYSMKKTFCQSFPHIINSNYPEISYIKSIKKV